MFIHDLQDVALDVVETSKLARNIPLAFVSAPFHSTRGMSRNNSIKINNGNVIVFDFLMDDIV
jgi:hypothetical protein